MKLARDFVVVSAAFVTGVAINGIFRRNTSGKSLVKNTPVVHYDTQSQQKKRSYDPEYPHSLLDAVDFVVQKGKYGAKVLRVFTPVTRTCLLGVLLPEERKATKAVYVCLSSKAIHPEILSLLNDRGYRFHHHLEDTREFIFYRWFGTDMDMVPPYASSVEGAGVVVFSQDATKVLLVRAWGQWMHPGGAVDKGEGALEAAVREVREEVDVDLSPQLSSLRLVASWNSGCFVDSINNHYMLFAARAPSDYYKASDEVEGKATWMEVDLLLKILEIFEKEPNTSTRRVHYEGEYYDFGTLVGVRNFLKPESSHQQLNLGDTTFFF